MAMIQYCTFLLKRVRNLQMILDVFFLNEIHANPKKTGAWKGRLRRFFVDPYAVELAKNGNNII